MSDTITYLPTSALRESPFNPRLHYAADALQDLAASIQQQGVLQPIVVRPLPDAQQDALTRYEIVFGHRRYRAAASLPDYQDDTLRLPCIVRDMDDQQAACAQVAENMQRQDVTAMEEADSLARLHREHNLPADKIAEQVGKSRTYVYNRIKLAAACSAVRLAVASEGLSPEVAIEVARLRGDKLQQAALAKLRGYIAGEWQSYRQAKAAIKGMFSIHIDEAPFDPADATLAKRAGACTTCPRRAGNDPDLRDELDADICTEAECYDLKLAEHRRRQVAALRAQGATVIEGDAAAALILHHSRHATHLHDHTLASAVRFQSPGYEDVPQAQALQMLQERGHAIPAQVHLVVPATGEVLAAYTDADAEALEQAWHRLHHGDDTTSTPSAAGASAQGGGARARGGRPDLYAEWTEAERLAGDGDRDTWLRVKRAVLASVVHMPRTTDDLRTILMREYVVAGGFGLMGKALGLDAAEASARAAAEDAQAGFDEHEWMDAHLANLSADALGALLLGVALEDRLGWGGHDSRETAARCVALAERYGVDVVAAARPPEEVTDEAGYAGTSTATDGATTACAEAGAQVDAFEAAL